MVLFHGELYQMFRQQNWKAIRACLKAAVVTIRLRIIWKLVSNNNCILLYIIKSLISEWLKK